MDIKAALSMLEYNSFWLDRYIQFLEEAPAPTDVFDRHHILPQALFPEFKSFRINPWNKILFRPSDHLVAHYYLYRAFPSQPLARAAFVMMVGIHFSELVEQKFDETLVREIAEQYEAVRRQGVESTIKGWVRIYKTEEECSVCPVDQLESFIAAGWKAGVPKRVWVMKGEEQHRILLSEIPAYLQTGFVLGRNNHHTEQSRAAIQNAALENHKLEAARDDAYSYLPRGDQHHRRILGCPDDVAKKISKTLTGRPKPSDHPIHFGIARGKHWTWSEESRKRKSEAMMGEGNNRFGKEGYWKDKTRPAATRKRMSDSHQKRKSQTVSSNFQRCRKR